MARNLRKEISDAAFDSSEYHKSIGDYDKANKDFNFAEKLRPRLNSTKGDNQFKDESE